MADNETAEPPLTEAKLRFMCEQLREWGGLPEDEVRRIYEAESKKCEIEGVINSGRYGRLAHLSTAELGRLIVEAYDRQAAEIERLRDRAEKAEKVCEVIPLVTDRDALLAVHKAWSENRGR